MHSFTLRLLIPVVLLLSACGSKSIENQTLPTPPKEHPRLFLKADDIPTLREKMTTPQGQAILERLGKCAIPRTAQEEAEDTDRGFRYYFKMRGLTSQAQLDALEWLVNRDSQAGRRAITGMLDSLKRTSFGTNNDLSRASGVMIMVGSMVYDWCYDLLDAGEKQAFIDEFIRIAGTMECGWPPKSSEPIAGHGCEWMILRDLLSAGIAVYDEAPQIYEAVAELLASKYIPARNYVFSGRNYHQGSSYFTVRLTNDLIAQWIIWKMSGETIFTPDFQWVPYDVIYRRRPDGMVLPAGDANPLKRGSIQGFPEVMMLASSFYHDPYLRYEYERKPSVEPHLLMMQLLWDDFELKGKEPDGLPLTRYCSSPYGWMIARTGWDENSAVVEMKVNEQFVGNHQHLDGGSFQIYHKGPLAIDSGSYQGSSGGYNSPHCKNYFKRTIAHNSLLIMDPDEVFECWNYGGADKTKTAANDGGQRMCGDKWKTCNTMEDLMSEEYTVGRTLAHSFGPDEVQPDYSFLKGDITKAYTSKVGSVRRSFVFFNFKDTTVPGAVLTYDHIMSREPSFKKTWLIHSIEEPRVNGTEITIERSLNGDDGILKCNVLLPDNPILEKIGGPGREFEVGGINYENFATTRPDPANERGAWRVEESPSLEATEDRFLNVIQIADHGCTAFRQVCRIESENVVGAILGDRAAIFSKNGDDIEESLSIELPSPTTVLFTDLSAGTWEARNSSGKRIWKGNVSAEEHCAYIECGSGKCELKKLSRSNLRK